MKRTRQGLDSFVLAKLLGQLAERLDGDVQTEMLDATQLRVMFSTIGK
jgi:hypothetical protein